MLRKEKWLIIGFASLLIGMSALAQQRQKTTLTLHAVVEQTQEGRINWTHGYVEAFGEAAYPQNKPRSHARLLARRGAIMDAQRNLLEIISGVKVSAESEMRELIVISDIVRTRLEGMVKGAQIIKEQDLGESYRLTMRLKIEGELATLANRLLKEPEAIDQKLLSEEVTRFSPPQLPSEKIFAPPAPPKVTPLPLPKVNEGPFTGLLIDCRGFKVKPSICPKIRDAVGQEIWGTVHVDPKFVIEHGIVGYLRDPKDITHPDVFARIGKRPLVVRAIGVGGSFHTDPLVSDEDARRILQENTRSCFLDEMRVMFLIEGR